MRRSGKWDKTVQRSNFRFQAIMEENKIILTMLLIEFESDISLKRCGLLKFENSACPKKKGKCWKVGFKVRDCFVVLSAYCFKIIAINTLHNFNDVSYKIYVVDISKITQIQWIWRKLTNHTVSSHFARTPHKFGKVLKFGL